MKTGNISSESTVQSPYFCGAGIVRCFVISQSGCPDEERDESIYFQEILVNTEINMKKLLNSWHSQDKTR